MRGSDRKLYFSKTEIGKVWKYFLKRIMNKESD